MSLLPGETRVLAAADLDSLTTILDSLTAATETEDATLMCKKTDDKPVCIDFFIMEARSAIFGGDNRTFNPDAGYRQSRIQLYPNPDLGTWTVKYNASTRLFPWGTVIDTADSAHSQWKPDSDVFVRQSANSDTTFLRLVFYNNYCKWRGIGCPTIDAKIWLIKDSSKQGGFGVYWIRDGMPAMGVHKYDETTGHFGVIDRAEDPEKIRSNWLNWTALVGQWEQSIRMPPGCNLQ